MNKFCRKIRCQYLKIYPDQKEIEYCFLTQFAGSWIPISKNKQGEVDHVWAPEVCPYEMEKMVLTQNG